MRLHVLIALTALVLGAQPAVAQWEHSPSGSLPSVVYRDPDWRQRTPSDTFLVVACLLNNQVGLFVRLPYVGAAQHGQPARTTLTRSDGQRLELAGSWALTKATLGTSWMTEVQYGHPVIALMSSGEWLEIRTPLHVTRVPLTDAGSHLSGLQDRCQAFQRERGARPNPLLEQPIAPRPPRGVDRFSGGPRPFSRYG